MHCLILFRDSAGRLPTAQELRECGFEVSTAALPPLASSPLHAHSPAKPPALALAAEPTTLYGSGGNPAACSAFSMPEQTQTRVAEIIAETIAEGVAGGAGS